MASLLTKPTYNVKICSNGIITQPLYEEQIKKGNSKKDSGIDLFCPKTVQIQSGEIKLIDMEVKCAVYKNGEPCPYYMYSRSSTPIKYGLILGNSVGIIDCGYRGSLMASFYNTKNETVTISQGTRLVQICMPNLSYDFSVELVNSLDKLKEKVVWINWK